MKHGNGRLIYDGIQETLNAKVALMHEILRYKVVQEHVAKLVAQNKELRKKLRCLETPLKRGTLMRFDLFEEDLEVLFDAMCCGNIRRQLEKADMMTQVYGMPLMSDEVKIELDITYFVVHAIVMNEVCRAKLEEMVTDREEYLSYWEKSEYNYAEFEICIPAEHIWNLRVLVGMVEKLRKEEFRGQTYRMFMDIIYAGNGYWKRQMKGKEYVSSKVLKEMSEQDLEKSSNTFPVLCRIMLLLVMADDMKIPVVWDYELILMLQFFEAFSDNKKIEEPEEGEAAVAPEMDYTEFLKKFDQTYEFHNSLTELAVNPAEDGVGNLLFDIMRLFELSPRKFAEFALSEQECEQILRKSEKWSQKKYGYMLMVAHLCKYIYNLEQKYLAISKDSYKLQDWKRKQEEVQNENRKRQYQNELERVNMEKKQMAETILKQEQELSRKQKQFEMLESKLQENVQELGALRSYAYLMSTEDEELSKAEIQEESAGQIELWKEKKVLVVGGHVHWQNKLKELFPRWSFLTAGHNSLVEGMMKGREIIICNTEILNHSCYYKVIAEKCKDQKLIYVHSNNIQRCILELEAQMG